MCGIVGLMSTQDPVVPESLRRATATLEHRGPDAQHQWIAPSGRVGLGHARLSIIDLHTGDQPLTNEDGQIHAVVNGEFYDFERIRAELMDRGHRFRTGSDSEILLHLYEERGAHCLHELRGEFSLVLWDERSHRLFAARDRFGIKPLFYAEIGQTLAFASEAKALFAAGLAPAWDPESFVQQAFGNGYTADRTLFAGVRQVPPGHYLLASGNDRQIVRYWDFDYPVEPEPGARDTWIGEPGSLDGAYAEAFGGALDEAVRLRLRADVPVSCYLSGGIDSCAVLGLASQHATRPIRAYTLSFAEPEYDEEAIAREMAELCNAEYVPIHISQKDLAEGFSDAIWHAEQPFVNAHTVAKFLLSRAVRDAGHRVVLTGEGSDEILAGYPHFRQDMLLYHRRGQSSAEVEASMAELNSTNVVSRGLLMPDGGAPVLDSVRRVLGYVPTWMSVFASNSAKTRPLLSADFLAANGSRDLFMELLDTLDVHGQLAGRAPVNQSLYLWSKIALPNYILSVLGDRMEMAHSVEGRLPFLDHHVVETARSLPVSAKIRGTTEKFVLREVARPVITPTVYARQKHPFFAPPAAVAADGSLHEMLQETLRGPALERVPFYDPMAVTELLDRLPGLPAAERAPLDVVLMAILSTCVLAERFGIS